MLSFEVIRGQWRSAWGHSFDLSLVWTYFHLNSAVFSFQLICNMPIFLAIIILTILEVERSKKVIIYIIHMFEIGKFWVHQRSMKVSLRSVIWPQTCLDIFLCNADVFSFHLICNMPIFSWFSIFQFLRSENGGQKTLTYDGRSNQVIYTKNDARFGKYGSK